LFILVLCTRQGATR